MQGYRKGSMGISIKVHYIVYVDASKARVRAVLGLNNGPL
jgi:hypothetical protein